MRVLTGWLYHVIKEKKMIKLDCDQVGSKENEQT